MIEQKKMLKCFASLVFLLFCIVTAATAQTPQQIAQKAFRSTVLLVMEDTNGQPLSLSSGFFIKDSQIATNLHVVEGAARGYAKLVGKETKFNIEGYTAIDERRDLIILRGAAFGTQAMRNMGHHYLTNTFKYSFSLQDFANLLKYRRDVSFRKAKLPKPMNVTKLFTSLFKQDDCLFKT